MQIKLPCRGVFLSARGSRTIRKYKAFTYWYSKKITEGSVWKTTDRFAFVLVFIMAPFWFPYLLTSCMWYLVQDRFCYSNREPCLKMLASLLSCWSVKPQHLAERQKNALLLWAACSFSSVVSSQQHFYAAFASLVISNQSLKWLCGEFVWGAMTPSMQWLEQTVS